MILVVSFAVWLWSRPLLGEENETRVRIRQAVSSRYRWVLKALPLSAFKILVVVLQIITQVRTTSLMPYCFRCIFNIYTYVLLKLVHLVKLVRLNVLQYFSGHLRASGAGNAS